MKKMIIIAAALFAAAAAQAACVSWAISGRNAVQNQAGDGNVSGVAVFLILPGDASPLASAITAGTFLSSSALLGSGVLSSNGNTSEIHSEHESLIAPNQYSFAIVLFNETYTGAEGSSGYYKIVFGSDTAFAYPPPAGGGSMTEPTLFTIDEIGPVAWIPYTVIPEPTAMALLALGAAAVGLRRRFRK